METLIQDLRFALRGLIRNPGFSVVAIASLGLGIGVNSAIFSSVYQILMRPLPYSEAERLVEIRMDPDAATSKATLERLWDRLASFDDIAGWSSSAFTLTKLDAPERLRGSRVTSNLFYVLGVEAEQGRTLIYEDGVPGEDKVAVLSHGLWQRRYAGEGNVVGRRITLDGVAHTIVGIMPEAFDFPSSSEELWLPAAIDASDLEDYRSRDSRVVGRMSEASTTDRALVELRQASIRLRDMFDGYGDGYGNRATVAPIRDALVGETKTALMVLFGAVGFVLLIVCVNVANLLLTRAAVRQKEIAVRTALGASRGRVVRQLLTESLVLALIGGGLGLLLAAWTTELCAASLPADLPGLAHVGVGREVLAFTLGVSVLAGMLFGLAPASQTANGVIQKALNEKQPGLAGKSAQGVFGVLMVSEVAMALILVMGAALMIQSFRRLSTVDPGFEAEGVLTLRLSPVQARYPTGRDRREFWDRVLRDVVLIPGVDSVAAIHLLPFSGSNWAPELTVQDRPLPVDQAAPQVDWRVVTPAYFATMRIPLLNGRTFTDRDRAVTEQVAVVSNTFARRHFPGEDPLGRRVKTTMESSERWVTIVGVVGDTRDQKMDTDLSPQIYRPHAQYSTWSMALLVRTQGDPKLLASPVRDVVWTVDPEVPVSWVQTMDEAIADSMAQPRLLAELLVVFGALALVLGAVGVYGVMSYGVSQRSTELGVRMAFGAGRGAILRQVLTEAFRLVLAGLVVGVAGALALARLLTSQLYQVEPTDPMILGSVVLVLCAVGLVASYLPARKASRLDAVEALRAE